VDPALRLALGERLAGLIRTAGTAALLITHSREEALGLADRVVVLAPSPTGGQRAQLGAPAEVYLRPVSAVVAGLTGPVATVAGERRGAVLHTPLGDWPVQEGVPGSAQTAIVRPESLELCEGSFPVLRRRWSPPQWLVQVQTPAGPLWVEAAEPPPAATVGLRPRGPLWAVEAQ
jgi:ABC-type sulfate/molybdate transport systems ATPase subunit